jgi:hypothetical protein
MASLYSMGGQIFRGPDCPITRTQPTTTSLVLMDTRPAHPERREITQLRHNSLGRPNWFSRATLPAGTFLRPRNSADRLLTRNYLLCQ